MDIRRLVKPNIRSLRAYGAKERHCRVKLDANESPYGFGVLKSIKTNRYPDPEAKALRKLAARQFRIKAENILHGNGSDELIYYLVMTFGGPVMYPVPTFSMYGIISQALGEKRIEVPLDKGFDLDIKEMLLKIRLHKPRLIFLSSPNNPTGNCLSFEKVLKIIDSTTSSAIVVVDEAYQPFSGKKGFLYLLKKYKNLVILRTLSKIGFAGLRVGFMIACPEIVAEVNKVRLPFNLNSLSQGISIRALESKRHKSFIKLIISERERLFNEMKGLDGVIPYPSQANFILFRVNNPDRVYNHLLKKGILIKNMNGIIDDSLRVTVGTPRENRLFLKALKEAL